MATIQQIQVGFAKFVDNHVAAAYSGIEKAVVLGGSALLAANLPKLIKMYGSHPTVAMLGVYNAETGHIDVDALRNAFVPNMGAEKIPIALPKLGSMDLGTIKLGAGEIDTLVRYIKES